MNFDTSVMTLKGSHKEANGNKTCDLILKAVVERYSLDQKDIKSLKSRPNKGVAKYEEKRMRQIRWIYVYLIRKHTFFPLRVVAEKVNNKFSYVQKAHAVVQGYSQSECETGSFIRNEIAELEELAGLDHAGV